MRLFLTTILSAISLFAWAAPNLGQKVSLTARKISAAEAMKQISASSGVEFIVSPKIQSTRPISIDVKEANLKDVLDFFATELNAKWEAGAGNSVKFSAIK